MARFDYDHVQVPIIIQAVGGDLRLRGRPGGRLQVEGEAAQVEQLGEGQPFVIRCGGDARITVPEEVTVSVQAVGGDAKLTELGAGVDIQAVGGDLAVRNSAALQIKQVGGDLRIKRAEGDVTVEQVGGDATIRDTEGALHVQSIGADLYVRGIAGDCIIERVGADLVLNLEFGADHTFRFGAGADILCRVCDGTDARLILPADTRLELDVEAQIGADEEGRQIVTLGSGAATVTITEAHMLRLVSEDAEYAMDFSMQIEEDLEARLSTLEEQLSERLQGLDARIQARSLHLGAQAQRMAERAAERATRETERAAEHLRRSMERNVKRKREPGPRRVPFGFGFGDEESRPPRRKDPVTEQERLLILQMVQEQRISIEEAERLLAALDS